MAATEAQKASSRRYYVKHREQIRVRSQKEDKKYCGGNIGLSIANISDCVLKNGERKIPTRILHNNHEIGAFVIQNDGAKLPRAMRNLKRVKRIDAL